jgi:uncharacterized damage-inducible protein DinB
MQEPRNSFTLEPSENQLPAALAFLRHVRFRLREDYLVKIIEALEPLSEEQLWWRPNEASNSIGNLILHLAGNSRQWVIAGIGGGTDVRNRRHEFAERKQLSKEKLLMVVKLTLDEIDVMLTGLAGELVSAKSDAPLQRLCYPQGFAQTVFDALFHVVEHFSYHTGQIVYIAKLHAGGQIKFYDDQLLARSAQ